MSRVLVTGGASGLGAALANRYAARGDQVLVTDLAESADVPAGAFYRQLNVTSTSDWAGAVEHAKAQLGGIDILINNAGVASGGRIDRTDEAHWRRTFEVNVFGAVNGCQAVTPLFKQQRGGHIINVASLAGLVHPPSMSSYTAGKAAVVALSESLRYELAGWNIDVSVVCPSFFRSNLAASIVSKDELAGQIATKLINRAPLGAEDIAARVVKAADARKFVILPDRQARIAYLTKRFARPLYDRQMTSMGAKLHRAEESGQ